MSISKKTTHYMNFLSDIEVPYVIFLSQLDSGYCKNWPFFGHFGLKLKTLFLGN